MATLAPKSPTPGQIERLRTDSCLSSLIITESNSGISGRFVSPPSDLMNGVLLRSVCIADLHSGAHFFAISLSLAFSVIIRR